MKIIFISFLGAILFSFNAMATTILISSFEPFGGAKGNSTQIVAKNLETKFFEHEKIKIVHCQLPTTYFQSYKVLMACIDRMKKKPDYIVSLGETGCIRMKYETVGRNKMNGSQDNNGIQYTNEAITVEGKPKLNLTLDLKAVVSKLPLIERIFIWRSKNAGSFVCNNLSYLMAENQKDLAFSFVHIPKHSCRGSGKKIRRSTRIMTKIIFGLDSQVNEKL